MKTHVMQLVSIAAMLALTATLTGVQPYLVALLKCSLSCAALWRTAALIPCCKAWGEES